MNPIDLTDSVERRWFEALIWPEHAYRRNLARAAIGEPLRDRPAIAALLTAASAHRPIYWLHSENDEVLLRVLNNGRSTETKLANKDGHGRWLEWRQSS